MASPKLPPWLLSDKPVYACVLLPDWGKGPTSARESS